MKQETYIKLFIGVLLFITWLGLVIFNVHGADDLITAIKACLLGLGVYHLGAREGIGGAAPAGKEGGAALPGFLAAMGFGGLLMLAGCATPLAGQPAATPQQAVQVSYTQACATYLAGMQVAIDLRRAGKLNQSQIDQITMIDNQVAPICTGPLPTDPTQAAQQVTAAVTTLAILEAINKEQKP